MSGTLYVVATPIGNLEDITLRALRVLGEVSIVAAEDTRRTSGLLTHHGVQAKTVSFHEHNTKARLSQLLRHLQAGESVALVTDAGTPGVSDPGLELVQACIEQGLTVEPIPGVSAPLTALVASGFPLIPFTMYGFVPTRAKARGEWFSDVAATIHTFSFFEAPHRIQSTLGEAALILGNRHIVVGRELTKMHEEFIRGTASSLAAGILNPRGEFTIVVGPSVNSLHTHRIETSDEEVVDLFWQTAKLPGVSRRAALNSVARQCGRSTKDVYAAVEKLKK